MQLIETRIVNAKAELNSSQTFDTKFPSNIHLDLTRAGSIPNPHLGFNERVVQWVHEKTWRYSTSFLLKIGNSGLGTPVTACLVFEGLDTFATVYLDGNKILQSDNMFLSHRVDISQYVHEKNRANITQDPDEFALTIDFESALKKGDEVMAENGGERVTWNGHYSRVFVRKAQYHYVKTPARPTGKERS